MQAIGAAILAVAAAIGLFSFLNTAEPERLSAQALAGTWEMESVNGERVGNQGSGAIISQRVSLRDGKVRGETLLRADSDQANNAMPFPDESVRKVLPGADGSAVRVLWNGTYDLDNTQQMALHIGNAVYFAKVDWSPQDRRIELNQDFILTVHGPARYRPTERAAP